MDWLRRLFHLFVVRPGGYVLFMVIVAVAISLTFVGNCLNRLHRFLVPPEQWHPHAAPSHRTGRHAGNRSEPRDNVTQNFQQEILDWRGTLFYYFVKFPCALVYLFALYALVITLIVFGPLIDDVVRVYRFFAPHNQRQPPATPTPGTGRHVGIRRESRDDDEGEGVIVHPPLKDQQPPPAAQ